MMRWIVMLLMLLLCAAPVRAERLSETEIHDLFSQAKEKFREATRRGAEDPKGAGLLLEESILRFRKIIEQGGIENGKLHYNIGNAYLLKGELGQAIVSYRRARIFIPDDQNLEANLALARSKVLDKIPVKARKKVLKTLFFWHYDIPARWRFGLFVVAFDLIWLLALLKLLRRRLSLRLPLIALALVATLLLGSLIIEESARSAVEEGVIVVASVVGRKGPDAKGYQPSFKSPLHAGVELEIVEKRAGWLLVRLSDGRETWLPVSAVGVI